MKSTHSKAEALATAATAPRPSDSKASTARLRLAPRATAKALSSRSSFARDSPASHRWMIRFWRSTPRGQCFSLKDVIHRRASQSLLTPDQLSFAVTTIVFKESETNFSAVWIVVTQIYLQAPSRCRRTSINYPNSVTPANLDRPYCKAPE